jgi:zinc transporter ZupT
MTAIQLSLGAVISTLGGGLLALRYRDRLHYLLSFTAGVLLGVVSFELLPEVFALAHERAHDATGAMVAMVAGFLVFHSLEKFVLVHQAHEHDYAAHHHPTMGRLSALALIGHSLMDGVAIGLAFQAGEALGIAVALAVIAHDFCDGLNTVGLVLSHRGARSSAVTMLVLDALAPVVGAASTLLLQLPSAALLPYLGFFAGFLLYISVSDILPEAHSRAGPGIALRLIALTSLGAAFSFAVARIAG